ncbi:MAG: hypothetical protein PHT50_01560 [Candidatus Omnitrophica bacterium]|nr:hypothetical protein [Candidatus Omnitrophota bacterium]
MLEKNSLAAKLICIIFSIFILLSLEFASRIIFPETLMDKIILILKQDPILFWRQKSNIKTKFQGYEVATDWMGLRNKNLLRVKKIGVTRIICLGASPTFGWGVRHENTYPCQLEELLKQNSNGSFEVINAGVIGYSSYQGLLFLKNKIASLNPDIITVAYELNDIDKYRFFRSGPEEDRQLKPSNGFLITLMNFAYQSKLVRIFERIVFSLKHGEFKYFDNTQAAYSPGKNRVSPSDYQKNLEEIIDFSSRRGIKVILVKMPVNLPLPEQIAGTKETEAEVFLAQGKINLDNHRYGAALTFFLNSIKDNPYLSDAYYYSGICYEKGASSELAKLYFRKAREKEAFRCGSQGQLYNNIMETVANKKHTPLVDIVSAFNKNNKEYLFVDREKDPIHPNAIGHKIIGSEIYSSLISNGFIQLDKN